MPAPASCAFICRTAGFVGSSTASRRRITVIGRITSRYFSRTYTSRSTSSAMAQMKPVIQSNLVSVMAQKNPLQPHGNRHEETDPYVRRRKPQNLPQPLIQDLARPLTSLLLLSPLLL